MFKKMVMIILNTIQKQITPQTTSVVENLSRTYDITSLKSSS